MSGRKTNIQKEKPHEVEKKLSKEEKILIDDVPQRTQDIVIENMEQVAQAVKNNVFTRSFSSCVKPYGKCEFWGMCYKESMDGLVKEEEK